MQSITLTHCLCHIFVIKQDVFPLYQYLITLGRITIAMKLNLKTSQSGVQMNSGGSIILSVLRISKSKKRDYKLSSPLSRYTLARDMTPMNKFSRSYLFRFTISQSRQILQFLGQDLHTIPPFRNSPFQRFPLLEIPPFGDSPFQRFPVLEISRFRDSPFQDCPFQRLPLLVIPVLELPRFRASPFQRFHVLEIPPFRDSPFQSFPVLEISLLGIPPFRDSPF